MLAGTRWRRLVAGSVVAALTLGLAGCGDRPNPDATVRVAITRPQSLLPTGVTDGGGAQVLSALFTPLVRYDDDGRPVPAAAESITPDETRETWTITLRDGFTFHNGEPVTADNYLTAWRHGAYQPHEQRNSYYFRRIAGYAQLNPPGDIAPVADQLAGVQQVDDRTFTVTLTEPFGEFPALLGAPAFYPLPQAAFDDHGRVRPEYEAAPVGNGPYRLVGQAQPDERIRLTRYEQYPGEPAPTAAVEFRVYPGPDRAYDGLRADEVDLVTDLPVAELDTVAEFGDRVRRQPSAAFQFLAVPDYQEPLADPAVRRAVSMAIDREALINQVFHGARTPARGFVPPTVPGAEPGRCGAACRHDPATARQLYHDAGGPAQLTFTYNVDGGHHRWLTVVCEQLVAQLNIGCDAQPTPGFTDLVARLDDQQPVGLLRAGWVPDYPSMASYLGPLFTSRGSANLYGYHNPEVDALVATGSAAGDAGSAQAAYRQAEQLIAEDLPVIPLWFGEHTIGYADHLRDVTVTRFGQVDLRQLVALD